MRGVQPERGCLRENPFFLVVPVDEDMTRRREDVGGATVQERIEKDCLADPLTLYLSFFIIVFTIIER
jgi:hypothetical protein